MFLETTLQRNSRLVDAALALHRDRQITPNTYVVDVDAVAANATALARTARHAGVKLYMMTKQIGRNPVLARIIAQAGIDKAVAVDPWEALSLAQKGIVLGNVGNLVQPPQGMLTDILAHGPEVVTVFSLAKAREVSAAARDLRIQQPLLLRVAGPQDLTYEGQGGGIVLDQLHAVAREIASLPNVEIAGVTGFPCLLYNYDSQRVEVTPNLETVLTAADTLRALGCAITQVNAPSNTSVSTIPLLAQVGATHGEPGHALTGTTPLHSRGNQVEVPALVYVSEISHLMGDEAFVYGGGFYGRSRVQSALVGNKLLPVQLVPPEYIDYYGVLDTKGASVEVGNTAIFSFRTQIFVTRSRVALLRGINRGRPELMGIFDSLGREVD